MSNNLYVDIHGLQILPPSNVNRDDTGSPKSCTYGGVNRARVSSQAWKRAIRKEFKEIFSEEDLGSRTLRAVEMVADSIQKLNSEISRTDASKMAETALTTAGIKIKADKKKEDEKKTEALLFLSNAQANKLAELAVADEKDKKAYKSAIAFQPSVDLALFGRMVASDPSLNIDATCQVAHAISTHQVENEYDYFTAVDDLNPDDTAGAGHIGNTEFNSSVLYRYATINVKELQKYLGLKTVDAVVGFLKAFVMSMPTGKQNSFANRTIPSDVYITVRTDQPVSLVGAFENPVKTSQDGYSKRSAKQMAGYAAELYDQFVPEPEFSAVIGSNLENLGEKMSFKKALEAVGEFLEKDLSAEEA